MNKNKEFLCHLKIWSKNNLRKFEWRESNDPYKILIAEVLLRRTTSTAAAKLFKNFLLEYPSIYVLSRSPTKILENFLKPIGYQKERAKILKKIAKFIIKNFGGMIPSSEKELNLVPHIGKYTSGAILSLAFNEKAAMIDSNVKRVISRVFFIKDKSVCDNEIEKVILDLLPDKWFKEFNLGLIDLGGTICVPRLPKCYKCSFNKICDYVKKHPSNLRLARQ